MRRWWVAFGAAFLVAVAVAVLCGWLIYARLEPSPTLWLSPDRPVEVEGLRLSNPRLAEIEAPAQLFEPVPEGGTVALLSFDVEVLAPAEQEGRQSCEAELVTPDGTVRVSRSVAVALRVPWRCDADAEGNPLAVGQRHTVAMAFVVRPPLGEPRVRLSFPANRVSVGVHPQR